jgi:hypothetical protein
MHTRELQAYLLCRECEQLLNRNGETWVLPQLAQLDGPFPLLDMLEKVPSVGSGPELAGYLTSNSPEIDTNKIVHFALGIFWKAAVHSWSGSTTAPRIDLGPYEEQVRQFLLGVGPYPRHMALLTVVAPRGKEVVAFMAPEAGKPAKFHAYRFLVPGIEFNLYVGKLMPKEARECCIYSSLPHFIMVNDLREKFLNSAREANATARKSKRLSKK